VFTLVALTPVQLARPPAQRAAAAGLTQSADIAFASNLIGVMVGGMFEYLALATGYQSLLLLVVAFYALALVPWRRADEAVASAA